MPTYEYRCKACGAELEVVQAFTDDALTTCATCGGPLRKVFGSVGISFKGSGFYKTDSRTGAGKTPAAASSGEGSSSSGESSSSGSGSSDGSTSSGNGSGDKGTGSGDKKASTPAASTAGKKPTTSTTT